MTDARRLGRAFSRGRPALVVYLMAGYPDRERSLEALLAATEAGADLIELGTPYTDQLADGPVIVNAATQARDVAGGTFGLMETLDVAREYRARAGAGLPLALMCYLNPLLKAGYDRSAAALVDAGVEGVIVPDLPPDMADPWLDASRDVLDTVFLAAPTSTAERLRLVGERSAGFVYCVSTTGVTGARSELPEGLEATVARVRANTRLPVAVGFGVSTPVQAAAVARIADGVVVGSALVRLQHEPSALAAFVAGLRSAMDAPGGQPTG